MVIYLGLLLSPPLSFCWQEEFWIKLISHPAYKLYKDNIFSSGKGGYSKAKDFRYNYAREPYFKLLSQRFQEKVFRVELVYLSKNIDPQDVTKLPDVPVHCKF
ncbi:MAG: hypothetical protein NC904_08640 [Candidatus Omnitrophica bacterium]|nr:hypothetical protein [Candidatus Omnitrophota bacterium]